MTNTIKKTPAQAWKMVLWQLQTDMPRASFDTWVSDTEALSYEDGCLTIGVRNAYARDWLESRLASTVSRLLIGIMNRTVSVEFVVSQSEAEDDDLNDDDESDGAEPGRGLQQIDAAASTRYEEEVKPHRIVMFPGYALRLLEQGDLSAKEMSLWVAFRQAVYATRKKVGDIQIKQNIPHQEVIKFANMSKPSFFRAIAGGEEISLSGGLVRRLPDQGADAGNPYFDNAIRWEVSSSPRLTLRDAAVIAKLLETEISLAKNREEKIAFALDALRRMTNMHPVDWLGESVDTPKTAPSNVKTILRRVLGIEDDIPANLFEAAEALENRLMSAFGKVIITHHFLQVTAPSLKLTQAQMWAIISLRDHRYYDHEKKAQYDYIIAKSGIKTLAEWSGVSLKSFRRWMDTPVFGSLIQKVDIETGQDEYLDSLIASGGEVYRLRGEEPPLWFEEDGDTLIPHWTKREPALDKVITGTGQSDNRLWTKRYTVWDKVITGIGQSDNPLNNLIKPHLNPFKPHKPHPNRSTALSHSTAGGLGNAAYWDFDFLMRSNAVNPGTVQNFRKRIKKGASIARLSELFVSWLLYAHSPVAGHVQDPVSIAIRRIQQNPHAGMPDFDRLAALRPFELKSFFDADFAGQEFDENDPDSLLYVALYREYLAPLQTDDKRRLYRRLFGG